MKKTVLILHFTFYILHFAFSQVNLVPNPSFEDTVACPTTANQIDKAVGWKSTRESPDYFNECNFVLTGTTAVPTNFQGFQYANSGDAYVGFVAYYNPAPNGREYFSCQLTSPLEIGVKYWVSYYLNLADGLSSRIACNKVGLMFSTLNFDTVQVTNSCLFYSDSIVSDTLNWVHIQGSFIADSNYQYMTVGNFFDDANTDTIMFTPFTSYAYYYFDNISIIKDTAESFQELSSSHKTTIFPNPATGKFIIATDIQFSLVEIINSIGNFSIIFQNYELQNHMPIPCENFPCGIYFIKIFYRNQLISYHKLLKL